MKHLYFATSLIILTTPFLTVAMKNQDSTWVDKLFSNKQESMKPKKAKKNRKVTVYEKVTYKDDTNTVISDNEGEIETNENKPEELTIEEDNSDIPTDLLKSTCVKHRDNFLKQEEELKKLEEKIKQQKEVVENEKKMFAEELNKKEASLKELTLEQAAQIKAITDILVKGLSTLSDEKTKNDIISSLLLAFTDKENASTLTTALGISIQKTDAIKSLEEKISEYKKTANIEVNKEEKKEVNKEEEKTSGSYLSLSYWLGRSEKKN